MRGMNLIAAMLLLTSCGSERTTGERGPNGSSRMQEPNQATSVTTTPPGPAAQTANASGDASPASACLMQGSERLAIRPIRAVGTEPFWSARIEGRCVTYSTPEDQQGTRVWTRYSAAPNRGGGIWTGQLANTTFELRTRPQAGCSDGMSDEIYPIAVELTVGGEQRQGCAEPISGDGQ